MRQVLIITLFFVTFPLMGMSQKMQKTKIEFVVENWNKQQVTLSCVEEPSLSITETYVDKNPIIHVFEINEITSFMINGRIQVCVEPGESVVVNVKYKEKPMVESTFTGNAEAVTRNQIIDEVTSLRYAKRIKYDPLAAAAVKTIPKEYHEKSLKCLEESLVIINDPNRKVSDNFRNYFRAQTEAILLIPILEYPFIHSDVWNKDFDEFVPDDFWTFMDSYVIHSDNYSLRNVNYNYFLMNYKNYLKRKEIKKSGETNYLFGQITLEQEYKELAKYYEGSARESVLFNFLSVCITNGKDITKVEKLLSDYLKNYNPTKKHKSELQNMMQ